MESPTWDSAKNSEMSTAELVSVITETFRDLPDNATVSIGTWINTPGELLSRHFNARLAVKVGDLRQIKNDLTTNGLAQAVGPVERRVMHEWYCENCRRVFSAPIPQCCGPVAQFDVAIHGRALISGSNAWIAVWSKWRDHPTVRQAAEEWAKDGNCSAAGILNDAFERMTNADA